MIGGVVALAIATIGVAYAVLVLRSAPGRRDNVWFGALALTDAAMTAWRGINVVAGESIVDAAVTLPCALMTAILSVISVEFIYAFPRSRPMTWPMRLGLWVWCAIGLLIIVVVDSAHEWGHSVAEIFYFAPVTLLIMALGVRSLRRTRERDARTVIGVLGFRWAYGFAAYFIAPALGLFEQAVWVETTVATLLSFVVIGTSVLRSELFSIRSSAAEAIVIATLGFVAIVGGGACVRLVLAYTTPGTTLQSALLIGTTLVPLHLAVLGRALYPRLEKNVLAGLDERRARRLGVQADPLPVDVDRAIAEATKRIAAIGEGSSVKWAPAAELPPALAADLRDGLPRRKGDRPVGKEGAMVSPFDDLPACFVVPALGGDRGVVGAFYINEGTIDRDTYIVARDLAAHIALAVERANAMTALEDARRLASLGQFAAAIAHDIRTPLTSISLNIQILQRKLELSDDDAEHLDIALEELRRLDRSVAEILDFAKPVKLVTEAIDVGDLLETAAKNLSPVLSEKNIALRCEPGSSLAVTGDAQRLRQVLVNLVDNAADASSPGTEVTLRAARTDGAQVAIEVEDRGKGITPDDLRRIFEPFFTTRPDGTGLGLAICQKVVRAHGGELRVRSSVGEGSTFTVLLPAAS